MSQEQITQQIAIGKNIAQASGEGASAWVTVYEFATPAPIDAETLAAAQARLAQLPLHTIPDVGTLPKGSRMPFRPNPLFVGREADLKALAKVLKAGETTAIGQIAAATGLGGIGKTQLASEFVHRYGQYFEGGVFWLSFATSASVPTEVAICGRRDHLSLSPDFERLDLETQLGLVSSAWQSPLPRLLVFDNCENEVLLAQWRPPSGGCRVLVTSRRGEWDMSLGVQALRLEVLSREESVALLRKFRPHLAEDEAKSIAKELGDLPLALHLAGSFLKAYQHDVTPTDYLAELQAGTLLEHESLQGLDLTVSLTNHDLHVGRTFALSYESLQPNDPKDTVAMALLARAAHFAPGEPIPRDLLLATLDKDDYAGEHLAAKALRRLVSLGLMEEGADGALRLHRLLALFVQSEANDPHAQAATEQALIETADRLNEAKYAAPLYALQPHLRVMTDAAMQREDTRAADLCSNLGFLLRRIGDYARAWNYYHRCLEIRETVLEENHLDTATILEYLSDLADDRGDYDEALRYCKRSLAIRKAVLGENHPDTATGLDNLGLLLHNLGDYAEARRYYERALSIREAVLGEHHPDVAISLNNLGVLFDDQGDYAGARRYYERALMMAEEIYGPNHPELATDLTNFGKLLRAQGDYQEARQYIERALVIHEAEFGKDHPDTAWNLNSLGELLHDQGDYAGARQYYERALSIRETALEKDHPDIAWSLNCLGDLLCEQGDYAGARSRLERALNIYKDRFGEDNPDTAATLNSMGVLLMVQGDYMEAHSYLERALAVRKANLNKNHPDIARTLNSLGSLFHAQGDDARARRYIKRALKICELQLGPDHPTTRAIQANLATLVTAPETTTPKTE